jgi:hypothetical protein
LFYQKVLSSLLSGLERSLGALNTLSTSIVTYAEGTNQSFPFVRMGNFAVHAAQTFQSTNALIVTFAPIVKREIRDQWESFASSENSTVPKLVNETLDFMATFEQNHSPIGPDSNFSYTDKIFNEYENDGINASTTTHKFHIPAMQTFPLASRGLPVNYGKLTIRNLIFPQSCCSRC